MKLLNTLSIYPGAPGVFTAPNGAGVHAVKLSTTGAPRNPDGTRPPGRTTLDMTLAFDNVWENYLNEAHFITMLRATPEGWDTGAYRGHGAILGGIMDGAPRAGIESWGPAAYGGPGGHLILPLSQSGIVRGETLYRMRVTSLLDASGYKHIGYALWQPNQPPMIDTGDCEDDNADVDMNSDALFIGAHMPRIPGHTAGMIRLMNVNINHTSDCTPMPDLRNLTTGFLACR